MGGDEIVDEGPDLIEVKLGGGVRIHHGGVVDMLALADERRFNRETLNIDVCLHQGGELRRQRADMRRLNAALVDQHRHFNAAPIRKIGDQAGVRDIPVNDRRNTGFLCGDDRGRVFVVGLTVIGASLS